MPPLYQAISLTFFVMFQKVTYFCEMDFIITFVRPKSHNLNEKFHNFWVKVLKNISLTNIMSFIPDVQRNHLYTLFGDRFCSTDYFI